MKIYSVLIFFIFGCATIDSTPKTTTEDTKKAILPRYKVGDCLMLVDPSTGSKPTRHRVKVEKINLQLRRYYYRWLLDNGKWDTELSSTVGKFEILEKITQKVDCP